MAIADGFLGGFPNLATWSGVVCRVKTQLQKRSAPYGRRPFYTSVEKIWLTRALTRLPPFCKIGGP